MVARNKVTGRIASATAQDFEKGCGAWIDKRETRLVEDLSALEYTSCSNNRYNNKYFEYKV